MSDTCLHINETRFKEDFHRLTQDGATIDGGLNRPALSEAHLEARETFRDMILERGFIVCEDGAGNLSAIHQSFNDKQPVLLMGSHLDSVANGGRFDGTLGVATAFEAAQILRDYSPDISLEVIDFTDEEGTWVSLLGSRAASGQLTEIDLENPRGNPEAFQNALDNANLTIDGILSCARLPKDLLGYLEVHIEQGTRLEKSDTDIGIVTGMVGIHMYLVNFLGEANHAGTTPMDQRHDASLGASKFCLEVNHTVKEHFTDCVATVGRMDFSPGAFNIVANQVTVFMELRSDDLHRAKELEETLHHHAMQAANQFDLKIEFNHLESVLPQKMASPIISSFEASSQLLGLSSIRLPSLAGHDAQSMAHLCPSGMIFVPSSGGFSHSSLEFTPWDACINVANTLLNTANQVLSFKFTEEITDNHN